jgi:Right handed beta helix region
VLSATSTPSSYITISNNKIHDTSSTGEGDALRFDGWNHITVANNDIYNIRECAGSGCHTDTLQSYNGGVPTTGLTITKNYTHNNVGAQGLPFLKDGDISNVLISDNLSVHNSNTKGQVTGVWVDENIVGLTIINNTYQGTSGSIVQADGSAHGPTVAINHNVFDNLNVRPGTGPSYTLTEDYDIFSGNDEYTFKLGPHSLLKSSPGYMNTATDDYRLASNPNHIGIDWSPAGRQYGPAA